MYVAPKLSHQRMGSLEREMPMSESKDCIHNNSQVELAKLRYSASVVDRATVSCFLEHQETRFDPRKTQYAPVDLRSV